MKEKLKISLDANKEKLSHLEKHEYDPNCNFCINNVFVKDAKETEQIVSEQVVVLDQLERGAKKITEKLLKSDYQFTYINRKMNKVYFKNINFD